VLVAPRWFERQISGEIIRSADGPAQVALQAAQDHKSALVAFDQAGVDDAMPKAIRRLTSDGAGK
jgi:hypothetical protein